MGGGGEILLKLCVFPGCFFVLVEVVFELGDLIFKLNVLVTEAVGLIWEFDHSGRVAFPALVEFFFQGQNVVVEKLNLFGVGFDAYSTIDTGGAHIFRV